MTLELNNRKLLACLGEEPHTSLDTAVHDTMADLDRLAQDLLGGARCDPMAV